MAQFSKWHRLPDALGLYIHESTEKDSNSNGAVAIRIIRQCNCSFQFSIICRLQLFSTVIVHDFQDYLSPRTRRKGKEESQVPVGDMTQGTRGLAWRDPGPGFSPLLAVVVTPQHNSSPHSAPSKITSTRGAIVGTFVTVCPFIYANKCNIFYHSTG